MSRQLLLSYGLIVEPVLLADAERVAVLWLGNRSRCLADRICLATAERLGAQVWTADTAWGSAAPVHQIR